MLQVSHANRGQALETMIEMSNAVYARRGIALIHKVPTEWKPLRGRDGKIVSAKVERKATVDFLGVWQGRPVAFDAKSCREKTRFPLANIEPHQVEFLRRFDEMGGAAFLVVEMTALDTVRLIPWEDVWQYIVDAREGGRKSIPAQAFGWWPEAVGRDGIVLDYLGALMDEETEKGVQANVRGVQGQVAEG